MRQWVKIRLLQRLGTHLKQIFSVCELHLSFDGIVLMHNTDGDLSAVHRVALTPENLERDMADLRLRTQDLCNGNADVKLVLPHEQVKFLTLDFVEQPEGQLTAAIEQVLEQQTPYNISELRYDYKIIDTKIHVAAVAIETLQEAEHFAQTHGFSVVASQAPKQNGVFENGAYFGRADDPAGCSLKPIIADDIIERPDTAHTIPEDNPAIDDPVREQPEPINSVTHPDDGGNTAPFAARRKNARPLAAPTKMLPTQTTKQTTAKTAVPVATNPTSKSDAAATLVAQKLAELSVERAIKADPSTGKIPAKEKQTYKALAAGFAVVLLLGIGWLTFGPSETVNVQGDQTQIETQVTDAGQAEQTEQVSLAEPQDARPANVAEQVGDTVDTITVPTPPQTQVPPVDATPPADQPQTELQVSDQRKTVTYSDQEVQRIYAATGIWVRGPDRDPPVWPEPLGDIYFPSIDRGIELQDAVALPSTQSYETDARIRTPASPAPAGTIFELNALGLVQATTEGALAPEGYTVFLGRPSVTPPENPQADIEPVLNDTRSLLTSNGTPLIDLRPRPRPALSVLEAPAQQQNDALALLRPKTRPDTISALSEAMATPSTDSGLTAVPTPKIRPSTLQTTALSPEEAEGDEAVATTSAAPRIPSNAKVSEEATIKNALKLNDLNLIGVFGSGSNKRALVRFANGKRQMVSVGDRLDGGKVAAIGDTELRYVKGGRNVVLKLPRG